MVAWFIVVAIAVAVAALSVVLMPRPKAPKPDATTDFEDPTADAGRPMPGAVRDDQSPRSTMRWATAS
jgi:hypothetical protein